MHTEYVMDDSMTVTYEIYDSNIWRVNDWAKLRVNEAYIAGRSEYIWNVTLIYNILNILNVK